MRRNRSWPLAMTLGLTMMSFFACHTSSAPELAQFSVITPTPIKDQPINFFEQAPTPGVAAQLIAKSQIRFGAAVDPDTQSNLKQFVESSNSGNGDTGLLWSSVADYALMTGHTAESRYALTRALAAQPKNAALLANVGFALTTSAAYDDAIDLLLLARAIAPHVAPIHFNLGTAYLARKDCPRAIVELLAAHAIYPEVASYRYQLGMAFENCQEPEAAIDSYRSLLFLDEPGAYGESAEDRLKTLGASKEPVAKLQEVSSDNTDPLPYFIKTFASELQSEPSSSAFTKEAASGDVAIRTLLEKRDAAATQEEQRMQAEATERFGAAQHRYDQFLDTQLQSLCALAGLSATAGAFPVLVMAPSIAQNAWCNCEAILDQSLFNYWKELTSTGQRILDEHERRLGALNNAFIAQAMQYLDDRSMDQTIAAGPDELYSVVLDEATRFYKKWSAVTTWRRQGVVELGIPFLHHPLCPDPRKHVYAYTGADGNIVVGKTFRLCFGFDACVEFAPTEQALHMKTDVGMGANLGLLFAKVGFSLASWCPTVVAGYVHAGLSLPLLPIKDPVVANTPGLPTAQGGARVEFQYDSTDAQMKLRPSLNAAVDMAGMSAEISTANSANTAEVPIVGTYTPTMYETAPNAPPCPGITE